VPTFEIAEGFEITLWAENPLLYKPIQMNWDAQGRLWVASSRVYPQIRPGQDAEDAVIVLEHDGDARRRNPPCRRRPVDPTACCPTTRAVVTSASHQLLHFADTNADGRADVKQIVMSSFGTEDTHHNLHTLRWVTTVISTEPVHLHAHARRDAARRRAPEQRGIWRFDPVTWRMEIFTKAPAIRGATTGSIRQRFLHRRRRWQGVYHAMEGGTYFTYADMRREGESTTPGNWPKSPAWNSSTPRSFPTTGRATRSRATSAPIASCASS